MLDPNPEFSKLDPDCSLFMSVHVIPNPSGNNLPPVSRIIAPG